MAKKALKQNDNNILFHHTGMTSRPGCQCYGDCACHEDWVSVPYSYYTVKRINKKTTTHTTLEEALIRWEFVNTL